SQDAFFKYSVSTNNNVVVENGSLVVKNLTYYLDLTISDENLENLWNDLNNYIIENEISIGRNGDISNYLNYGIYNFFKNLQTNQNGKLEQFINTPTNIGVNNLTILTDVRDIKVSLKSGLYKMTSKNLNNDSYLGKYNIVVSNNSTISMNNLYLSSPTSDFTWNDTQITGLTANGVNAINQGNTGIILPLKCSSLSTKAFNGNSASFNDNYLVNQKIIGIDMSLSSITSTTGGGVWGGTFSYCLSLNYVKLPKKITNLAINFLSKTKISNILEIPNTCTIIQNVAFDDVDNLKITIPNNTKNIINSETVFESSTIIYVESDSEKIRIQNMNLKNIISSNIVVDASKFTYLNG
ncbi:MAG: leucine-rich repeat domain-containing protein, partial [Ureaplasma sp.]|nr:leucine-rich repeat domain-containing protein [Ureaplasma sp.]